MKVYKVEGSAKGTSVVTADRVAIDEEGNLCFYRNGTQGGEELVTAFAQGSWAVLQLESSP